MSCGTAIMEICNSSLLLRNRLFSTASAQPPHAPPLRRRRQFIHPGCCISSASRIPRPMAVGSDSSVDTDDMYDDLFKKYGKVVYTAGDEKSALQEVDDDAESLSLAVAAAKVASDVKAGDIKVLFVKPLVYWTRFFIIATAFSRPQIDAIGSKIKDMAEAQFGKVATGDYKPNSWTLLDFGDVVVHIFLPETRDYYNLEEFYANATQIDLPFER